MAIKTMTLDEVKKLPKLSKKRLEEIENFKDTDFTDCPELTEEQIKNLQPAYLTHPEWFTVKKTPIQIRIDTDVLEAFKATGKGYQTRMNEILRQAVAEGRLG